MYNEFCSDEKLKEDSKLPNFTAEDREKKNYWKIWNHWCNTLNMNCVLRKLANDMKIKKYFWEILFVLILIISGLIRFLQVKDNNTAFTFDQSRDMLDIRTLGEFKDLAVMGPTTSINGLRLGPFYYYLNLPAYWIGGGNPQALVYWNIVLFLVTGFFIFYFFKKKNIVLGFLISTMFLMAPQLFNTTRYFWNANTAIYLSVFYFFEFI
jgi:hypothetical protein